MIRAGRIFYDRLYKLMKSNDDFIIESTLSGRSLLSIINRIKINGFKSDFKIIDEEKFRLFQRGLNV